MGFEVFFRFCDAKKPENLRKHLRTTSENECTQISRFFLGFPMEKPIKPEMYGIQCVSLKLVFLGVLHMSSSARAQAQDVQIMGLRENQ